MSDADMNTPAQALRRAVQMEVLQAFELPREVAAHDANRRNPPEARAGGVEEVAEVDVRRRAPDVACVEERDGAERAPEVEPELGRQIDERAAARGQAVRREGRDLIAAPAAQVGRSAEEVALRDRHRRGGTRDDRADPGARRPDMRASD